MAIECTISFYCHELLSLQEKNHGIICIPDSGYYYSKTSGTDEKCILANAKTGPALHDSPDARILCDRRHHCRAVCAFHYQQNTGIKTDRRNLYLGIPRNPSAGTVIYHVLGYL